MTADKSVPVCSAVSFANLYNLSSKCAVTGFVNLSVIDRSLKVQLELFELADNESDTSENQAHTRPTELPLVALSRRP